MVYEVLVDAEFTARHGIRLPDGTVEPSHAHAWRVTVRYAGAELDECGLLIDFEAVKSDLGELVAELNGADLDAAPIMRGLSPTAEHVARVIFDEMSKRGGGVDRLCGVRVTEAAGCVAGYCRASAIS